MIHTPVPPRLTRDFFMRPTVDVAQDLLGKTLVFGRHRGRITETEAYVGEDDPASHSARGKTPRNAVMFDQAGMVYVYFIYGMYHCLNIVTEGRDVGAAVLIRGIQEDPVDGQPGRHLNGPGKLCRDWGITLVDNGRDAISDAQIGLYDTPSFGHFITTPRIGISKATDKLWRFLATPVKG